MLKRLLLTLIVLSLAISASRAQQAPDNSQQQQMLQQLQGMTNQIQQNMQNSGIDPQQFRDQMLQQMQDGTFDPQAMQQQLINQGIISQDMITQMQSTTQTLVLASIQTQLNASDEEWTVLQPKLQKIITLMADVDQNTQSRVTTQFLSRASAGGQSEVAKARRDLQQTLADPNAAIERIEITLRTWRQAHEKAKADLAKARDDLTNLLTLRQEAILLNMGVI